MSLTSTFLGERGSRAPPGRGFAGVPGWQLRPNPVCARVMRVSRPRVWRVCSSRWMARGIEGAGEDDRTLRTIKLVMKMTMMIIVVIVITVLLEIMIIIILMMVW